MKKKKNRDLSLQLAPLWVKLSEKEYIGKHNLQMRHRKERHGRRESTLHSVPKKKRFSPLYNYRLPIRPEDRETGKLEKSNQKKITYRKKNKSL